MTRHRRYIGHSCPGPGCREKIPPNVLLCRRHWWMVPQAMRNRLMAIPKPSAAYDTAARACVDLLDSRVGQTGREAS